MTILAPRSFNSAMIASLSKVKWPRILGPVAKLEEVCSECDRTERKMTKTRRKIDAALKAKIALEALREQATATDLAQRHQVHPNHVWTAPLVKGFLVAL